MVRQSKRDARLECMIVLPLYIEEHDKTSRSKGVKSGSMKVSKGVSFSFVFKQRSSVEQLHRKINRLNIWPIGISLNF